MRIFKMSAKKYALVTGAADRIGKAMSLELVSMGYGLLLHYRSSKDKAIQFEKELRGMGAEVELINFDFDQENDFVAVFENLQRKGITLEVLVNSASEFKPSGFDDPGSVNLHALLTSNFEGPYLLTKAFAKVFKNGVVINMLDTKITRDYSEHLDYILAKKMLSEFTKLAATHLSPEIRVNGICPGVILPPVDKGQEYIDKLATKIPLQRPGTLKDIQRALRFLVESDFLTGQIIFVDGGEHLVI